MSDQIRRAERRRPARASDSEPRGRAPRRLLVSIHDVGPRFEDEVSRLRDHLAAQVPLAKVAMLVVPDHWGEAPLRADPRFAARLRSWAEGGGDVFVHGWLHRDDRSHPGRAARWKARHMTAGEGEFLGLDAREAARRMREGRDVVEQAVGRAAAGFVAPAWLYGEGARTALAESGFGLAEDHMRVWRPSDGATLCRGPVITWASRSRGRIASSLAAAGVLRRALRSTRTVRLGVHPGDVRVPALMESIAATLRDLASRRTPADYVDLLPGPRG